MTEKSTNQIIPPKIHELFTNTGNFLTPLHFWQVDEEKLNIQDAVKNDRYFRCYICVSHFCVITNCSSVLSLGLLADDDTDSEKTL